MKIRFLLYVVCVSGLRRAITPSDAHVFLYGSMTMYDPETLVHKGRLVLEFKQSTWINREKLEY